MGAARLPAGRWGPDLPGWPGRLQRPTSHGGRRRQRVRPHRGLGFALAGAAVVILILALIARPGVLPIVLAGVLVVQTCLLQSLLAGLADNTALYGGLHALDGLLILGIAGFLYASARRWRSRRLGHDSGHGESAGSGPATGDRWPGRAGGCASRPDAGQTVLSPSPGRP